MESRVFNFKGLLVRKLSTVELARLPSFLAGDSPMSPSGSYDHVDRIGVRTRCSICGALGVNRKTCPKTTPEDHLAHRKEMNSYRKKYDLGTRDSIARTGVSEPRYEREWQSINNGDDLTLNINPEAIIGNKVHDLTLRIRVKIKVDFE